VLLNLPVLVPIPGQRPVPHVPKLSEALRASLQSPALIELPEDERIALLLIAFEGLLGFLLVLFLDAAVLSAQTVKQPSEPFAKACLALQGLCFPACYSSFLKRFALPSMFLRHLHRLVLDL
jgi:hypothetical protein